MGENPELIAMARRIAAETKVGAAPDQILRGDWDNTPVVRAALAAIIETQERDAALADEFYTDDDCGTVADNIATAIRSGQHYGKGHPHA